MTAGQEIEGADAGGTGPRGAPPPPDPLERMLEERVLDGLVILFYLPVALGSLLYLAVTGGEYAVWVHTVGEHPLRDAGLGLGVGLVAVALSRVLIPLTAWGRALAAALARTLGDRSLATCLVIAACSAVGEELLFRAVLQERLGIVVATVLFAAAHFPAERALWPWPLLAVPIGLVFGGLYDWTDAVLAPIVAHATINFVNLRQLGRLAGFERDASRIR